MNKENEHIDSIFKARNKNYRHSVDNSVWNSIHNELDQDKRSKKKPLYTILAVAASIAVFVVALTLVFQNKYKTSSKPVVSEVETLDAQNYEDLYTAVDLYSAYRIDNPRKWLKEYEIRQMKVN